MTTPDNKQKGSASITKEQLEQMYVRDDKSAKEISEELGISTSIVYNLCHKFGLKKNPSAGGPGRKSKTQLNIDDVKKLYVDDNKTIADTAEALGVSTSTVYNFMKKNGITKDKKSKYKTNCPSKSELMKLMEANNYNASKIARKKGVTRMTVYNWLHQNGIPTKRETQTDETSLTKLAIGSHKTLGEIAAATGCAEKVAKKNLETAGFELYIGE